MKKRFLLLPLMVVLILVTSCNNEGNEANENNTATDTTSVSDTLKVNPENFSDPH